MALTKEKVLLARRILKQSFGNTINGISKLEIDSDKQTAEGIFRSGRDFYEFAFNGKQGTVSYKKYVKKKIARKDAKECDVGTSCGNTCIEEGDTCNVKSSGTGELFKDVATAGAITAGTFAAFHQMKPGSVTRKAGGIGQAVVGAIFDMSTAEVSQDWIDDNVPGPLRKPFGSLVGGLRSAGYRAMIAGTHHGKIRSVGKNFMGMEVRDPSSKFQGPELHSVSNIGADKIVSSIYPTHKYSADGRDEEVRTISFAVNNGFTVKDGNQRVNRRKAMQTLRTVQDMVNDQVSALPDGALLIADPAKGDGRDRASLYRRFGFRDDPRTNDMMFARVRNGRLTALDDDDFEWVVRAKQNNADSDDRMDDGKRPIYKTKLHGMTLGIQYRPGDERHGRKLKYAYGWIQNTRGEDGMAIDAYLGPDLDSRETFRITQLQENGEFDEYKYMLGFSSELKAETAYKKCMPAKFFGGIAPIDMSKVYRNGNSTYSVNTDAWTDLNSSQMEQYDAALDVVQDIGQYSKGDVGFIYPSPREEQGHKCFNCAFYTKDGGEERPGLCGIVRGPIHGSAVCEEALIPEKFIKPGPVKAMQPLMVQI